MVPWSSPSILSYAPLKRLWGYIVESLIYSRVDFGSDPEFFFISNGELVESNKIIGDEGLFLGHSTNGRPVCTKDGVQAELNPMPYRCREGMGIHIASLFKELQRTILSNNGSKILFDGVIKLSEEKMDELSDESKKFGCAPSRNYYTRKASEIKVNPEVYPYRSAGGHIHIGKIEHFRSNLCAIDPKAVIPHPLETLHPGDPLPKIEHVDESIKFLHLKHRLIVRLLDTVVGNTCVLIDKNPAQKERRKVYGKAGEYRLPKHGLEYRSLSNFWLRSYQLVSFVFGLTRLAVNIGATIYLNEKEHGERSSLRDIFKLCSKKDVQTAINNNDFDLAKKNFDSIKDFLMDLIKERFGRYPFDRERLPYFEHFVSKRLDYWFPEDPVKHWTSIGSVYRIGWESFLANVVRADMESKNGVKWKMATGGESRFIIINR